MPIYHEFYSGTKHIACIMPSNTTSPYKKPENDERFIIFIKKSSIVDQPRPSSFISLEVRAERRQGGRFDHGGKK